MPILKIGFQGCQDRIIDLTIEYGDLIEVFDFRLKDESEFIFEFDNATDFTITAITDHIDSPFVFWKTLQADAFIELFVHRNMRITESYN